MNLQVPYLIRPTRRTITLTDQQQLLSRTHLNFPHMPYLWENVFMMNHSWAPQLCPVSFELWNVVVSQCVLRDFIVKYFCVFIVICHFPGSLMPASTHGQFSVIETRRKNKLLRSEPVDTIQYSKLCYCLNQWERAFGATSNAMTNEQRTLQGTRSERSNTFRSTRSKRVLAVRSERVLSTFVSPWGTILLSMKKRPLYFR